MEIAFYFSNSYEFYLGGDVKRQGTNCTKIRGLRVQALICPFCVFKELDIFMFLSQHVLSSEYKRIFAFMAVFRKKTARRLISLSIRGSYYFLLLILALALFVFCPFEFPSLLGWSSLHMLLRTDICLLLLV